MSMMNSGRLRRVRMTASTRALVRIGAAAPVAVMTMSLAASAASMSSQRAAVAPPMASAVRAACAIVRLTMVTWLHALRLHVLRRELAHLSGADHDHRAPVEIAEDLFRERNRGVADGDGAGAQSGFRPDALADGKGRVEQAVEQRTGGFGVLGGAVRLFDLAENLRFADDQRVESGRDAKEMAGRLDVRHFIEVRLDGRHFDAVERADERHQLGTRRRDILAGDVQLGAIARREHRHLAAGAPRSARRERPQRVLEAPGVEIDALAQLDGRGAMTDSDEEQMHGCELSKFKVQSAKLKVSSKDTLSTYF